MATKKLTNKQYVKSLTPDYIEFEDTITGEITKMTVTKEEYEISTVKLLLMYLQGKAEQINNNQPSI